jgi:hypothetical protein
MIFRPIPHRVARFVATTPVRCRFANRLPARNWKSPNRVRSHHFGEGKTDTYSQPFPTGNQSHPRENQRKSGHKRLSFAGGDAAESPMQKASMRRSIKHTIGRATAVPKSDRFNVHRFADGKNNERHESITLAI